MPGEMLSSIVYFRYYIDSFKLQPEGMLYAELTLAGVPGGPQYGFLTDAGGCIPRTAVTLLRFVRYMQNHRIKNHLTGLYLRLDGCARVFRPRVGLR